ncbi:MAG: hypothetical protein GC178_01265 [Flavobacteriales bacterium]|nr:hypothetical protein [Flavobacteriales bacterium]
MNPFKTIALTLTVLFLFSSSRTMAQDEWTLERCISYAFEHNIQIKQSVLQQESARLDKSQALAMMFPNLNASSSFNINFGRNIDFVTNTYVNQQINNNSWGAQSNVTLFNGFRLLNTFKQSQVDLQAAGYDLDGLGNDISLNIATAFMQIMFNEELLDVAYQQLEVTKEQLERTRKMADAGSVPLGNVYDVEAQLASNELQVVNAENALNTSILTLKQMLNLPASEPFRIERPEVDLPLTGLNAVTVGIIYDQALDNWPKIKAKEARLRSAEKGEKIAFASYTPTISGSASLGTRYSSAKSFTGVSDPYGKQLQNNLGENIGFSLSVPIFNGLRSRTSVGKARLSRINAELSLQDEKNKLYSSVQQAYNDASSSKRQFDASDKSVKATEQAFEYAKQRYDVGMMNALDFNTASNNLTRTRSELLRAKYDYIFKMKVLDFYQGKPITFDQTK